MLQRRMTKLLDPVSQLSDSELLAAVRVAAACERQTTAQLIALLAQVDVRRLYLGEGCSSLFTYCTQVLHLSEHAAYGRIEAARATYRFPVVLDLLTDGSVTLTAITLLAPHLTADNYRDVLDDARHKSKRQVEEIVARLRPQPAVPTTLPKLPIPKTPDEPAGMFAVEPPVLAKKTLVLAAPLPPRPTTITPLAPERYKVQFTLSRATHDNLRRVQDLMRHSIPNGDPGAIFERALTLLLADLEKGKLGVTSVPRAARPTASGSRHIPAAVRREVWKRDRGQCAFVGSQGRCTERGFLEFHHVMPYAAGGQPVVENIELRCRAHNLHEAEKHFGSTLPLLLRESSGRVYRVATRSGTGWHPGNCQQVAQSSDVVCRLYGLDSASLPNYAAHAPCQKAHQRIECHVRNNRQAHGLERLPRVLTACRRHQQDRSRPQSSQNRVRSVGQRVKSDSKNQIAGATAPRSADQINQRRSAIVRPPVPLDGRCTTHAFHTRLRSTIGAFHCSVAVRISSFEPSFRLGRSSGSSIHHVLCFDDTCHPRFGVDDNPYATASGDVENENSVRGGDALRLADQLLTKPGAVFNRSRWLAHDPHDLALGHACPDAIGRIASGHPKEHRGHAHREGRPYDPDTAPGEALCPRHDELASRYRRALRPLDVPSDSECQTSLARAAASVNSTIANYAPFAQSRSPRTCTGCHSLEPTTTDALLDRPSSRHSPA